MWIHLHVFPSFSKGDNFNDFLFDFSDYVDPPNRDLLLKKRISASRPRFSLTQLAVLSAMGLRVDPHVQGRQKMKIA